MARWMVIVLVMVAGCGRIGNTSFVCSQSGMEFDVADEDVWSWVTYGSAGIAEMQVDVFQSGELLRTIVMEPSGLSDIDWIAERGASDMGQRCSLDTTAEYRAVTERGRRLFKRVEPCCE